MFNSNIKTFDKVIILFQTSKKVLRGFWKKIFLKKSKGILLVGKQVTITHAAHIRCGKNVKFEDYCEIQGLCSDGIIFGDKVTIGRNVMIRPSGYYGTDLGSGLTMGNNSSIGPDGYVGCSGKILIGCNVMIGPKCSFFAENHNFSNNEVTIKDQGVNQKGIVISDNCWIGSNTIILDGVTIGTGVVIAAGSIVTKDIPENAVVMGSPAKIIRFRK